MRTVNLKLGKMRKEQEFVVQVVNDRNEFVIQSDKAIGRFNTETGEGKMNFKGCYFPHLAFAEPYDLTIGQLAACRVAMYNKGETLGKIGGSSIINMGITMI